jgi:hypothetical protein
MTNFTFIDSAALLLERQREALTQCVFIYIHYTISGSKLHGEKEPWDEKEKKTTICMYVCLDGWTARVEAGVLKAPGIVEQARAK